MNYEFQFELDAPFEVRIQGEPAMMPDRERYARGDIIAPAAGPLAPGDVILRLRETTGKVSFSMQFLDSEPALITDGWELIEQSGIEFRSGTRFHSIFCQFDDQVTAELTRMETLTQNLNGWHTIRVCVRRIDAASERGNVTIQIWPADGEHGLVELHRAPPATLTTPPATRDRASAATATTSRWHNLIAELTERGADTLVSTLTAGGATTAQIDDAAAITTGTPWPADLAAWFTTINTHCENLFPDFDLLNLDESIATRATTLQAYDWIQETAGNDGNQPVYHFIPAFIPIADLDGTMLVYDSRPGPATGQIIEFDKVDADDGTRHWDGLPELLDSLTATLRGETDWGGYTTGRTGEPDWTLQ
ncbi:SMI1/KNR4 family protein [Williamsia sp. CHRR-6]|uniref:SMI1/KNR4 family protein n=1 Tax=Williamsia sp. CHRR-6 TaxID=2835871 RepID=UPI001BD9375E|nr:SMI1/KNR4 family protein [Williamsia sp. CHRR-6]MBT0567100.1 hypothetical protein [Williamsia sp. CHRR-6]